MAPRTTKAQLAEQVYRCACGAAATYEATSRRLLTRREVREGVERVNQGFVVFYLCTVHAQEAPGWVDPPMHLTPLPHHRAAVAKVAAKGRKRNRLEYRAAQSPLGEHWGER